MKLIYAGEPIPKWTSGDEWGNPSIFLAGPTLKSGGDSYLRWRTEAINLLRQEGFEGTVYLPADLEVTGYTQQVDWEQEALDRAGCVLFWVTKDLDTLHGFEVLVGFGSLYKKGPCVLGIPQDTRKTRYLRALADKVGMRVSTSLKGTVKNAVARLGIGLELPPGLTLSGKRSSYSTGKEEDVLYFLGGRPDIYEKLPATVVFMQEMFGKEVPLSFEVDCYPDDGSCSCSLDIDMEYENLDEYFVANDHMIDRWVDQKDRPDITLQLCSGGAGIKEEDEGE